MARPKTDLRALRNLLSEADLIRSITVLPKGRFERARALLKAAGLLTDSFLTEKPTGVLGAEGANLRRSEAPDVLPRSLG